MSKGKLWVLATQQAEAVTQLLSAMMLTSAADDRYARHA